MLARLVEKAIGNAMERVRRTKKRPPRKGDGLADENVRERCERSAELVTTRTPAVLAQIDRVLSAKR